MISTRKTVSGHGLLECNRISSTNGLLEGNRISSTRNAAGTQGINEDRNEPKRQHMQEESITTHVAPLLAHKPYVTLVARKWLHTAGGGHTQNMT